MISRHTLEEVNIAVITAWSMHLVTVVHGSSGANVITNTAMNVNAESPEGVLKEVTKQT